MNKEQRAEYERRADREASAHIWESLPHIHSHLVQEFIKYLRDTETNFGVFRAMTVEEIKDEYLEYITATYLEGVRS